MAVFLGPIIVAPRFPRIGSGVMLDSGFHSTGFPSGLETESPDVVEGRVKAGAGAAYEICKRRKMTVNVCMADRMRMKEGEMRRVTGGHLKYEREESMLEMVLISKPIFTVQDGDVWVLISGTDLLTPV